MLEKVLDKEGLTYYDTKSKKYVQDEIAKTKKYCIVGSNTANTSGWYKVASQTMSGYNDTNVTFMITSTYKEYFSGILQLQMRSDNTFISCNSLKWHSRIGFDVGDVICVIEDMTFTLYVHRSVSQYGRILFEVMSESNITTASTSIVLHNSTSPETTEPVATVIATDGATVCSANQVNQIYLSTEDVDDIKPDNLTWYYTGGSTAVVNNPFGDGKAFAMCAYRAATGYRTQEAISYSGIKKVRYYNGTDWSDWRTLAYGDEYLPLGGGTLSSNNLGVLNIKRTTENNAGIGFENILGTLGYLSIQTVDGDVKHITADASKSYKMLDENNYKDIVTPSDIGAAEDSHEHEDYVSLAGDTMTGTLNVTRINPVSALTNNLGTSANPFLTLFTDTIALRGDISGTSYGALNVNTPGTADTTGVTKLVLGNNVASGTENNAKGEVTIYGTNTGSTVITAGNNSTSTVALTLPSESGTLALKSDTSSLSSIYNVLKRINIKSSGDFNNKICFVSKNPFSEVFNGTTYTGYSTINRAIEAEYNSNYTLNVIVLPGTYKESVNIVNKKINVFGVDKHTCIVTNDEGYDNPPFEICSGNTIANLTIICNDDGSTSYSNLAYCVHMDYDYSGSPITIDNCIMHSYQSACIGFGTRGGSPFYVTNCEMYKHANSRLSSHSSFDNGVVYGHNAYVDQTVAEEMYFINNYMEAETGYSIYIFNANKYYPGGNGGSPDTELTFVGNTIWSRDESQGVPKKLAPNYLSEVIPSYAYFGGGFIRTFGCSGNNARFLNYKNSHEPIEIINWTTAANGTTTLSDYIGKYNYLFIETFLNSNGKRQNYDSKMVLVNDLLNFNPKVQMYSITPSAATTAYYLCNFKFTENQMVISDVEIGSSWTGCTVSYRLLGVY